MMTKLRKTIDSTFILVGPLSHWEHKAINHMALGAVPNNSVFLGYSAGASEMSFDLDLI